jgi:hypothetical protein
MPTLTERYLTHYAPLVTEFVREVETLSHPHIDGMPEPFFPAFGSGYERSALRLIIIGQDTRGWGDLRKAIPALKVNPKAKLKGWLDEFSSSPARWGGPRNQFGGFAMMFLATLYGQKDWSVLRQGGLDELVSSFAWGNVNAVELYGSSPSKKSIPREYWETVRKAGARFDRFSHLVETLQPQAAIVLCRGMNPAIYFDGYAYDLVSEEGRLKHYRLPEIGVDVFHAPHPQSMGFNEGADHFCGKLKELFLRHGIIKRFPEFLSQRSEIDESLRFLRRSAPPSGSNFDKYDFVEWVAVELRKQGTFMSVPTLVSLVNERGYRTDYGTEFSGGRGSYKLVSGTYHRFTAAGHADRARNVAVAFRKPNFEYAYAID